MLDTEQGGGVPLLPSSLLPPLPPLHHHIGLRGGGEAAEEVTEVVSEDGAAEAVDEGVVAAVAHGQPVGDEEDEVDVFEFVDLWPAHTDYEVEVVGQPAEREDHHHQDQHLDDFPLPQQRLSVLARGLDAGGGRPPEPRADGDVGVADDGEGHQVLHSHAGPINHLEHRKSSLRRSSCLPTAYTSFYPISHLCTVND